MRLPQFIAANSKRIISEWEEFARIHLAAASTMDLKQRRDHVEGMLKSIAADLDTPQSKSEQASKAMGKDDANVGSDTAANAHGTDRAATGFSPIDVVSEFRALRASVLRLWSEAQSQFSREDLEEVTRFNEAIDQQLVESMTRYARDVDHSKDLFLGVLGHDLRNPLGAIMMSATVMMTTEGPDWPQQKTAARILNAGTRMDGLIGDLVDFTRNRLGSGIPLVRSKMDMETICRHAVDEISAFHPRCVVNFKASGDLQGTGIAVGSRRRCLTSAGTRSNTDRTTLRLTSHCLATATTSSSPYTTKATGSRRTNSTTSSTRSSNSIRAVRSRRMREASG